MEELAPFVLPATGGSAILAAFIYLLRYVSGLHKALGEAQAAAAVANAERAKKAEGMVASLQLDLATERTERFEEAAKWARRQAAATLLRSAFPAEAANWKFFEARIDEAVSGGEGSAGAK